jgi:hypothetical protein
MISPVGTIQYDIQIRGNCTTEPSPKELQPALQPSDVRIFANGLRPKGQSVIFLAIFDQTDWASVTLRTEVRDWHILSVQLASQIRQLK